MTNIGDMKFTGSASKQMNITHTSPQLIFIKESRVIIVGKQFNTIELKQLQVGTLGNVTDGLLSNLKLSIEIK